MPQCNGILKVVWKNINYDSKEHISDMEQNNDAYYHNNQAEFESLENNIDAESLRD